MENVIEIEYKGLNIHIEYVEDPFGPDWMTGKFVHKSNKYSFASDDINVRNWSDSEIEELLNSSIHIPVYLYDHGGITINTTGFSCPWDSGLFGYYIVDKNDVRKEEGVKRISKKIKEQYKSILKNEIQDWDDYCTGNVFGYSVIDNDGNYLESCGGYYGNSGKEQAIEEAKSFIDYRTSFSFNDNRSQLSLFDDVA
jgi:hypothetical protein